MKNPEDLHWDYLNIYIFLWKCQMGFFYSTGQIYTDNEWSESNLWQLEYMFNLATLLVYTTDLSVATVYKTSGTET